MVINEREYESEKKVIIYKHPEDPTEGCKVYILDEKEDSYYVSNVHIDNNKKIYYDNNAEKFWILKKYTNTETDIEFLERLANRNTCIEEDGIKIQEILRSLYFPNAIVIVGIVYPEGQGEPINIHTIARMILRIIQCIKSMQSI